MFARRAHTFVKFVLFTCRQVGEIVKDSYREKLDQERSETSMATGGNPFKSRVVFKASVVGNLDKEIINSAI